MFYKLNKKTLLWEKDKIRIRLSILGVLILVLSSFLFGMYHRVESIEKVFEKTLKSIVFELPKDQNIEYVDSLFVEYEKRANIYLSQEKFEKSPIKGFMLSTCAKDAYLMTGIYLPVELALAQAQMESSMGTKGRSPVNNPFNIGEYNTKTVMTFNSTYEGVKAYYSYMTQDYLKCRPIDLLLKNFTNCGGYRYAGSPDYEKSVSELYFTIEKYINKKKPKF
jgi:hypothetical protein